MPKSASFTPCGPVVGSVQPPGSKSITNRAIVCAALADGKSQLSGVLDSEDTAVMIEAWKTLGVKLDHDKSSATITILGSGTALPKPSGKLFIANSGTTIRFLTAALATTHGDYELYGVARMQERPIADLLSALQQLDVQVASTNAANPNCPPVRLNANGLGGGKVNIAGDISSQYLSGLMLAAPLATGTIDVKITGELVSTPYVEMTAEVMRSFGANIELRLPESLTVPAQAGYRGVDYQIEPDASAASYFWAAAAITGGCVRVTGLSRNSLQGDVEFCDVLQQMGCHVEWTEEYIEVNGAGVQLQGVEVNMANISDTVQTLAAVALFASGPTTVRGIAHNRVKETDRITDLVCELRKFGATVEEFPDGLKITPPVEVQAAEIETYSDHRMAMSLSLVGLRVAGVVILDPECTAKTFPNYFDVMASVARTGLERQS
ncbi:MAG TPA: 3-phosphoshikimate 1-carboxyvinyltransferase [Planctomycetaceae bacterium]|nr:3-phosphoshikimate 1-carboxyvinyltransferase [Planctomycetaceae bacterium]